VGVAGPVPGAGGVVEESALFQEAADLAEIVLAEALAVAQGQLKGSALQVRQQDLQVLRIDVGVLRRAAEEVIGMLHDVLIERRAARHQHRRRRSLPPPGASRALPTGSN